ncbi:hypothetical protein B0I35DRAFT_480442 [Stachybotrys elegans]|uniref:Glycosyl transferase CAP10 domain-containing protein n=1 Tax=Stachybotrys elegans TaxID=80388 RepID=A0A8K0STP8_9HYPO|nr:hypothetical protein B0I35DRAFT_480442 [Stachybotrys elegans]
MGLQPAASRSMRHVAALVTLPLASAILASDYQTSAAFERPIHFTTFTLLITGFYYLFQTPRNAPLWQPNAHHAATPKSSTKAPWRQSFVHLIRAILGQLRLLPRSVGLLLGCMVFRSYFFWSVMSDTPCASRATEALLPLLVVAVELLRVHVLDRAFERSAELSPVRRPDNMRSALLSGIFALLWASWAMSAADQAAVRTSTPCIGVLQPPWFIHFGQYLTVLFDAVIITYGSRLVNHALDENASPERLLAIVFIASGVCVSLLGFPSMLVDGNIFWLFDANYVSFRDLIVESLLAFAGVGSAVSLLLHLHPTTVAALASSPAVMVSLLPAYNSGQNGFASSNQLGPIAVVLGALALAARQFCFPLQPTRSFSTSVTTVLHKWLFASYMASSLLVIVATVLSIPPTTEVTLSSTASALVENAKAEAQSWASQASTSKTLSAAVNEYQRRYGIPPPPGFDRWFQFAKDRGSLIIDDFDQIHKDLLPFWGMKPAEIRDLTSHLLRYPALGLGGVRIRGGRVEQSPHIPGTHRWMTNSIQRMIEPFSGFLPDMDLAINLADECRVAVNYEAMQEWISRAGSTRRRALRNSLHGGAPVVPSHREGPAWPENFPEPVADADSGIISPHFTNYLRRQLYYDVVAPTCPPRSMARNTRWWDRSTVCSKCAAPHSAATTEGTILVNTTLANDVCHQPDLAYLSGFMASPANMVATNVLVPIFSQGRVGGFSDILIPSPWNFDEKSKFEDTSAVEWTQKSNSLFWRGSSTDGYAADGSWAGFTRTRLVSEGYRLETGGSPLSVGVNVSFTGDMNAKCHQADCAARRHLFPHWAKGAIRKGHPTGDSPLPEMPFDENWHYRHLIDMDGAGFSGRFLPFLESHSLVYRAALFRTWYEERIQPWYHYVPVDIRLGPGFWGLVNYFGGAGNGSTSARDIANQGREWAQKVTRQEDMQIYLFRLLLEWGRLVNDDREYIRHRG